MQIQKIRSLVKEYNQKGLSLETRKIIQKLLGKEESKRFYAEYSEFFKDKVHPNIIKEKLNIETIDEKNYITTNLFLKKDNLVVTAIAELNKINLENVLQGLKKLTTIKKTNTSINYKTLKNTTKYTIECISDNEIKTLAKEFDKTISLPQNAIYTSDKHFKITDKTNKPVAIFSLQEDFFNVFLGNFIIKKSQRNTKTTMESVLAIRDFLKIYTEKTLSCAVEMKNSHLVKLYQKFGFKVETIYSMSENNTNEITSAYTLKLIRRKRSQQAKHSLKTSK